MSTHRIIRDTATSYGCYTEYATIDNITRDDLIAFHRRFFVPNNVMLAVWGDFDTRQMARKIQEAFKGWQKVDAELAPMPQVQYEFRSTANVIRREDINQSCILLGHIGGMMNDPDYFALVMMNEILGGSFTSRLFKTVRSRMGLAYSVFGFYSADYDHPGVFYVGCMTKSQSTLQAIRAMIGEVRKMTESEVNDEENTHEVGSAEQTEQLKFDMKEVSVFELDEAFLS